jgi:protein phosphatase
VVAGYGFLRWYGTDSWYVALDQNHLAVYQGRPGGFLWFQPRLVDRTDVTTSGVLAFHLPALHTDQEQPTLAAAKRYIDDLHAEYEQQQLITSGQSTVVTTTTTAPPTKAPSSTTNTAPG